MRYLLILLFSINLLNASMLLESSNQCIESFYIKDGKFYYVRTIDLATVSVNADNLASTVLYDYTYDSANNICSPSGANSLGLLPTQYNFLLALCGLIFGGVFLFFTVDAFTKVGGKR